MVVHGRQCFRAGVTTKPPPKSKPPATAPIWATPSRVAPVGTPRRPFTRGTVSDRGAHANWDGRSSHPTDRWCTRCVASHPAAHTMRRHAVTRIARAPRPPVAASVHTRPVGTVATSPHIASAPGAPSATHMHTRPDRDPSPASPVHPGRQQLPRCTHHRDGTIFAASLVSPVQLGSHQPPRYTHDPGAEGSISRRRLRATSGRPRPRRGGRCRCRRPVGSGRGGGGGPGPTSVPPPARARPTP